MFSKAFHSANEYNVIHNLLIMTDKIKTNEIKKRKIL